MSAGAIAPMLVATGAVVTALLLPGCDPLFIDDVPGQAVITVHIGGGGRAELRAELGRVSDDAFIRAVTADAASALFPGAAVTAAVDENDGGWNFGVARIDGVYRPGERPIAHLDTAPLVSALVDDGYRFLRVFVCPPAVRFLLESSAPGVRSGRCLRWDLDAESVAPSMGLTMHPQPLRGWVTVWSAIGAIAAVVTCWIVWAHWRDRIGGTWVVIVTGVVGIAIAVVAARRGGHVDDLTVSGKLSGTPAAAAGVVAGLGIFAALVGGIGGVVAGLQARTDARRAAARAALPPPP
jgi:hypothetical protein